MTPLELSRLMLESDGYAVLPLTGFVGAGPDLVGIDDRLGLLGVCVGATRPELFPKLAAVLLSTWAADRVRSGRLRVVGHLWEGRKVRRIELRADDFACQGRW
jgi:hypothetical protein